MLKDGKYSVWFRTPLAEGTGVVVLAPDGKLSGGDTIMLYTGIAVLGVIFLFLRWRGNEVNRGR